MKGKIWATSQKYKMGEKDIHIVDKISKNNIGHKFEKPIEGGNVKYKT